MPALAGLTRESAIALLDRAAGIGLLESLGGGHYQIHPALPWYFTTLYTATYGDVGSPAAQGATRAYAKVIGSLGHYYLSQAGPGLRSSGRGSAAGRGKPTCATPLDPARAPDCGMPRPDAFWA